MNRQQLTALPAVIDVPTAAKALGLSRTAAYELIRAGEWPTPVFRLGRLIRIPTAPVLELLGTEEDSGEVLTPLAERLIAARADPMKVPKLSDARIRRVHATLMSALNTGVKRRKLPANPARHVEVPTGRRPKSVVWTAEQTGVFLDAAASDRLYPIYHLIAYRGLRRGEAVGLRWVDVDLDGGGLTIAQQVLQIGWEVVIGAPKTGSGERPVSLDEATVEVLRAWKKRQTTEKEQCAGSWQDTGLVFTREDGAMLHPDAVTDLFHAIATSAGLPPIRLHDLRHTAASLALQAGAPLKVVSEALGHSSLAITADTYTSVLPDVAKAAAEAVAGIIPRAPKPEAAEGAKADT